MSELQTYPDRDALHNDAARRMGEALRTGIDERGEACAALSGGSTPAPIYERLSAYGDVEWAKVRITLVDERLTEPGDPASNEVLVRNTLLKNDAAAATFVPLQEGASEIPRQDAMLLGMGSDGHFASLFPTANELDAGVHRDAPAVLRMTPSPLPENAPFPRLTLTLRAILEARTLVLAITGEEKRRVLEEAATPGDVRSLPIRALLRASHPDFSILWAP